MSKKLYLGDGVYFEHDGYVAWLTTENGGDPTNTIALEPEVITALLRALGEVCDKKAMGRLLGVAP